MGRERDQGETEAGERQGETELGGGRQRQKEKATNEDTHVGSNEQTGTTEAERVLASGRDGEGEGDGVRAAETQVSLGSGGVRAIREGHSGLGSPAGAGPAGYRRGPSLPPHHPHRGGSGRVTSYQVTAGFGSFSLARPQPIREQRRCSRAGGPEMHLPPTPSEARGHTITVAHTLTLSQGRAASPAPHTHTITATSCHTHAAPGTRRDIQHRRRTKSQGHSRSSRAHSTAQAHSRSNTQHYPNTQPH